MTIAKSVIKLRQWTGRATATPGELIRGIRGDSQVQRAVWKSAFAEGKAEGQAKDAVFAFPTGTLAQALVATERFVLRESAVPEGKVRVHNPHDPAITEPSLAVTAWKGFCQGLATYLAAEGELSDPEFATDQLAELCGQHPHVDAATAGYFDGKQHGGAIQQLAWYRQHAERLPQIEALAARHSPSALIIVTLFPVIVSAATAKCFSVEDVLARLAGAGPVTATHWGELRLLAESWLLRDSDDSRAWLEIAFLLREKLVLDDHPQQQPSGLRVSVKTMSQTLRLINDAMRSGNGSDECRMWLAATDRMTCTAWTGNVEKSCAARREEAGVVAPPKTEQQALPLRARLKQQIAARLFTIGGSEENLRNVTEICHAIMTPDSAPAALAALALMAVDDHTFAERVEALRLGAWLRALGERAEREQIVPLIRYAQAITFAVPEARRVHCLAIITALMRATPRLLVDVADALRQYAAAGGSEAELAGLGISSRSEAAHWKLRAAALFPRREELVRLAVGSAFHQQYATRIMRGPLLYGGVAPTETEIRAVTDFHAQASDAMQREMEAALAAYGPYPRETNLAAIATLVDDPHYASLVAAATANVAPNKRVWIRDRQHLLGPRLSADLVWCLWEYPTLYERFIHLATRKEGQSVPYLAITQHREWTSIRQDLQAAEIVAAFADGMPYAEGRAFLTCYRWAFRGVVDFEHEEGVALRRLATVWSAALKEQLLANLARLDDPRRVSDSPSRAMRAMIEDRIEMPLAVISTNGEPPDADDMPRTRPTPPDPRCNRWTQIADEWKIDDEIAAREAAAATEQPDAAV